MPYVKKDPWKKYLKTSSRRICVGMGYEFNLPLQFIAAMLDSTWEIVKVYGCKNKFVRHEDLLSIRSGFQIPVDRQDEFKRLQVVKGYNSVGAGEVMGLKKNIDRYIEIMYYGDNDPLGIDT